MHFSPVYNYLLPLAALAHLSSQSKPTFNLANPSRTIRAGVIPIGKIEILYVAPMDMLHSISKQFANDMPISDELKAKMLDIEFHWVTEKARPAKLTAGITMKATASLVPCQ
jgi:hypothetical protein